MLITHLVSDRGEADDFESESEPEDRASRYMTYYGEVQYFFTVALPAELSLPEDILVDSDRDDDTGLSLQALALVRKFPVVHDNGLYKRVQGREGPYAIIHVKWIRDLIGLMTKDREEFIVKRWHTLK